MKIKNRTISSTEAPLIIAELGINHGGDLLVAEQMVKSAADRGCEVIKHQTHFLDDEMTPDAKKIMPPNANVSIWDVMEKCSLTKDEEIKLKKQVEDLGMIYISTPFSRSAADFLNDINVPAFKIGSGECDNLLLIEYIADFGKPIILSTGMQNLLSVEKPVEILERKNIEYALLECTNIYPCPPEDIALGSLAQLSDKFPNAEIGFSDHSIGPTMALAAIALGATIVEKHFTDTKDRQGPDISCSMDPAELEHLIKKSKEVAYSRDRKKFIANVEKDVYKFARSSIVSDKNLKKGDTINRQNIWARRPGNGEIPAFEFEKVLGKTLKRDVARNTQIKWSDLE
ncbi:N-acetylneuraminate synthase family protein [Paracoccaceae bacterium]|nr:N-acetylneuraminate synthase family protein [Paracoccaceae bacterium]